MSNDNKPTIPEKISGNPILNIGANITALAMGGVTALLPALLNTLAFGRFQKRIEKSLQDISNDLEAQKEKLDNLTDAQFKLLNETVVTVLSTINEEKLAYLRNAINNTLDDDKILDHESVLISRIIRDISVDEIKFLIDFLSSGYEYIFVKDLKDDEMPSDLDNNCLKILQEANERLVILGLDNLGLLIRNVTLNTGSYYGHTQIAEKVRNLFKEKTNK